MLHYLEGTTSHLSQQAKDQIRSQMEGYLREICCGSKEVGAEQAIMGALGLVGNIKKISGLGCPRCHGRGYRTYSSGATWRGGMGTTSASRDVCDQCWGSGLSETTGTNLRQVEARIYEAERNGSLDYVANLASIHYRTRVFSDLLRILDYISSVVSSTKSSALKDLPRVRRQEALHLLNTTMKGLLLDYIEKRDGFR